MKQISRIEDRLIEFSGLAIEISYSLPHTSQGKHLSNQLYRSASSVSLNYGEAMAAESRRDFIHKMKVSLKELRETHVCLKLIRRLSMTSLKKDLEFSIDECDQLIAIFVASVKTAIKNSPHM